MEKLKDINRRILVGTILTLCALFLWLVTTPSEGETTNIKNILSAGDLEAQQIYTKDIDNYNRATVTDNRYFCEKIVNNSLKDACKKEVVRYEAIEPAQPVQQEPEQTTLDIDAYNRATVMKDQNQCMEIQNEELKVACVKEIAK